MLFIEHHVALRANIERQVVKLSGAVWLLCLSSYGNNIFSLCVCISQPKIGYWMSLPSGPHHHAVCIIDLSFKLAKLRLCVALCYVGQRTADDIVYVVF